MASKTIANPLPVGTEQIEAVDETIGQQENKARRVMDSQTAPNRFNPKQRQ